MKTSPISHRTMWIVLATSFFMTSGVSSSSAQNDQDESCGLGPPPGSPSYAEYNRKQEADRNSRGYLLVCDHNLERFDLSSKLHPLERALPILAFKPVDLTTTPLSKYRALGAFADRNLSKTGPEALYRVFVMDNGRIIYLSEWDMSISGGESLRDPADEPEKVNGNPARLDILQTKSGKAVSQLSWFEGRRLYELWINSNVKLDNSQNFLFDLASSLPKSVPTCAAETNRRSSYISKDGIPQSGLPEIISYTDASQILHGCVGQ